MPHFVCCVTLGGSLASLSLDSFCFDEITDPGVGFFFFSSNIYFYLFGHTGS